MIDQIREKMRDKMWTLTDIAAYYGKGMTYAKKVVAQPGFPPKRVPWHNADPVWSEREVRGWAESREAA